MRLSVRKMGRYSYHSLAFSAGFAHGIEDGRLALRGLSSLRNGRFLKE